MKKILIYAAQLAVIRLIVFLPAAWILQGHHTYLVLAGAS